MEDTITFSLLRTDDTSTETIEVSFDHSNMDIHDVFKKFGAFLISVSYTPESIQYGANQFDIEAL